MEFKSRQIPPVEPTFEVTLTLTGEERRIVESFFGATSTADWMRQGCSLSLGERLSAGFYQAFKKPKF
jgi:hypothetical protein